MKVIIAGSRDINDYPLLLDTIEECPFDITEVVCGMARGVDTLGKRWAEANGIPVTEFPANWSKYGRAAGPIRNEEMAKYADALIAVRRPESRGTKDMVKRAIEHDLRIHERIVE